MFSAEAQAKELYLPDNTAHLTGSFKDAIRGHKASQRKPGTQKVPDRVGTANPIGRCPWLLQDLLQHRSGPQGIWLCMGLSYQHPHDTTACLTGTDTASHTRSPSVQMLLHLQPSPMSPESALLAMGSPPGFCLLWWTGWPCALQGACALSSTANRSTLSWRWRWARTEALVHGPG